jgi:hypothetical protein
MYKKNKIFDFLAEICSIGQILKYYIAPVKSGVIMYRKMKFIDSWARNIFSSQLCTIVCLKHFLKVSMSLRMFCNAIQKLQDQVLFDQKYVQYVKYGTYLVWLMKHHRESICIER